ncbi:MAG: YecA family protein [Gammaproteobacteria bacterium]|nr:MAG: YecA family protein [Gammaproteobacteria bacterium]
MNRDDFLQPEELDKLQTTLVEHMQPSGSMPLDAAHGFLTATAAHPGRISAEQARARVLGEIAGEAGIEPLLRKFHEQLLRDLESGEYGPLIMQMPREDGSVLPLPYGWCEGYVLGLNTAGDDLREKAAADQQAAARLTPIFAFLMYDEQQMFDPPDEQAHRETVGELGEAAVWLHHWWRQQEQA